MRKLISIDIIKYQDDKQLKTLIEKWLEFRVYYNSFNSDLQSMLVIDEKQNELLLRQDEDFKNEIVDLFQKGQRLSLESMISLLNKSKTKVKRADNKVSKLLKNCFYLYYVFSPVDRLFLDQLAIRFDLQIEELYPADFDDPAQVPLIDGSWQDVLLDSGATEEQINKIDQLITDKIRDVLLFLRVKAISDYQKNSAATVFTDSVDLILQQYFWLPEYRSTDNNSQLYELIEKLSTKKTLLLYGEGFLQSKEYINYSEFKKHFDENRVSFQDYHKEQQFFWSFFRAVFSNLILENIDFGKESIAVIERILGDSSELELSKKLEIASNNFWSDTISSSIYIKKILNQLP